MPPDLKTAVRSGTLTMVDCEFAGYFIAHCHLHDILTAQGQEVAGMSAHYLSDNSPTVGIVNRQASRALSPMPAMTLRRLARLQRRNRSGPQTIQHWPGELNTMADIPSRSYEQGYPAGKDASFLAHFSHTFHLPLQLKSWKLVQPRTEICSDAFSLLRRQETPKAPLPEGSGAGGANSQRPSTNIRISPVTKEPPAIWNEATCSWPLLLPCGKACTVAESPLPGRQSRERFEYVDRCWQAADLRTLGKEILIRTP